MIIDTSSGLTAKDLLRSIRFDGPSQGVFVVQRESNKKLAKVKIRSEHFEWLADYLQRSRFLSVSSSAYLGSNVLPNFFATKVVSVALNCNARRDIKTPQRLFEEVCGTLADKVVPTPSALIVSPTLAFAIWVLDRPFFFPELADLYTAEHFLATTLRDFGATLTPRSASRFLPLPTVSADGGMPVVLLANGTLKTVTRERLMRVVRGSSIPLFTAEFFAQQTEVLEELGCLLHARSLDVAARPEINWAWMSGYGAAIAPFVEELELKDSIRKVAESLGGAWADIKDTRLPGQEYQYQSHLDLVVGYSKGGVAKLGMFAPVESPLWPQALAQLLNVTKDEIETLGFRRLVPPSLDASVSFGERSRGRAVVGYEEYVSLDEFLRAA